MAPCFFKQILGAVYDLEARSKSFLSLQIGKNLQEYLIIASKNYCINFFDLPANQHSQSSPIPLK